MKKTFWMAALAVVVGISMSPVARAHGCDEGNEEGCHGKFTCKVKDICSGSKKKGISFPAEAFKDETDALKAKEHKFAFGKDTLYVGGGISKDDECKNGTACRWTISLRVDSDAAGIAYANSAAKVGVIQSGYKMSCTYSEK